MGKFLPVLLVLTCAKFCRFMIDPIYERGSRASDWSWNPKCRRFARPFGCMVVRCGAWLKREGKHRAQGDAASGAMAVAL
jgi:hypothetical protein